MKRAGRLAALAAATVMVASGGAQAAPVVQITSPVSGATISRAAQPELLVTGTAAFAPPVESTRTFYLRRDACTDGVDNERLSVVNGSDGGDGCGLIGAGNLTTTYPAADGVPVTVDADRNLTGKIVTSSFEPSTGGIGAGQAQVRITLKGTGADGAAQTIATGTQTYLVTPGTPQHTATYDLDVPAALDDKTFTALSLDVTYMTGVVLHSFTALSGASFVTLPIMDSGTVLVSDSSSFSATRTVTATLAADGTWQAQLKTPTARSRVIYARATQAADKTDAAPVGITVTP